MNARDQSVRSESDAEEPKAPDASDAIERELKEAQAQTPGDRTADYYIRLGAKVSELIDELSARDISERPTETIENLKALRAEIELQIKAAD